MAGCQACFNDLEARLHAALARCHVLVGERNVVQERLHTLERLAVTAGEFAVNQTRVQ